MGRKRLLGEARKDLAATRLITLTGVGGVGKTRLALQVARGVVKTFPDGVWLVDLTPHRDADLVTAAVAATLGLHDSSESSIRETLLCHVRARTALLVLDNCEHVIEGVAGTVAAILDSAPDVRVLLTSREPLGLEDERVIEVPPLAIPSDDTPRRATMDYDAARLLVARAADAGRADFAETADPALVARLCQRLDGIPLAIVLAAARLYSMSLADVVARVDDQFALLNRGGRGMQDHHQTLWDCIAWSHELCSQACRVLWARLSVFTGPFRLDDAVAVCADDAAGTIGVHTVVDLLDDLVRQSVVTRYGEARYRLLDPLRGYGCAQLAAAGADEELRWRRRHAGHYRHLAVRAAAERFSPRHVDVVATIRRELPNLRAALEWCVERPDEAETAVALVVALSQATAWFTSATVAEGRRYVERALDLPDSKPSLARVQAAMYAAWFGVLQSDPEAAVLVRRCHEEAARVCGDDDPLNLPVAYASYAAGLDLLFGSSDRAAIAEFDRATRGFRRADVPGMAHLACLYLALAALRFHETEIADTASRECLYNAERHGDATAISWARWTRGLAELDMGDVDPARERFRQSLIAQRDLGTYWGTEWIVESLAWCAALDGRPEFAAQLLGAAATLRTVAGRDSVGLASFRNAHVEASRLIAESNLSADAYEAAFESGANSSYQDAIALALGEPGPRRRTAQSLTKRQRDVAALVAQGMTSRDIAARLYISRRTVETHLAKIMAVLNVRTRVEVATWWSKEGQRI